MEYNAAWQWRGGAAPKLSRMLRTLQILTHVLVACSCASSTYLDTQHPRAQQERVQRRTFCCAAERLRWCSAAAETYLAAFFVGVLFFKIYVAGTGCTGQIRHLGRGNCCFPCGSWQVLFAL